MNLENFTQAYKSVIAESQDDTKFVNYITSIVEEVVAEKTTKNKLKNRLAEAHDGGPFTPTYPDPDKLPLTNEALYGLSRYDPVEVPNILDMIKIDPAEYNLEEIEKILVRLKDEKGLTSTQYTDFIEREEDDQKYLTGFTKYQYLLPAEEFFDWVKSGL